MRVAALYDVHAGPFTTFLLRPDGVFTAVRHNVSVSVYGGR
jgi:hypothetical protein